MYSEKNLLYILTILECHAKVEIYTQDTKSALQLFEANDQLNFNAVVRLLHIIGEETQRIELALKNEFPHIPWAQIAGTRNRLVHDYRGIDYEVVWEIAKNYIPNLAQTCENMISKIDFEKEMLKIALSSPYYTHLSHLNSYL